MFLAILETAKQHRNPKATGFNQNLVRIQMEKEGMDEATAKQAIVDRARI